MKSSSKADFLKKEPIYMSMTILAARKSTTRLSSMRLDLFCKQISLTLIIFDKNEGM